MTTYFSAKSAYTYHDQQVNMIVYSDGSILWIPPKQLMSHCAMDMRKFPFDQHKCQLKFGSWTFDGNRVSTPRGVQTPRKDFKGHVFSGG
jgi:nicotinic acetylcholine receptor